MRRIIFFLSKKKKRGRGMNQRKRTQSEEAASRGMMEMNRNGKGRRRADVKNTHDSIRYVRHGTSIVSCSCAAGPFTTTGSFSWCFTLELLVFNKHCIAVVMKVGSLLTKESCGSRRAPDHKPWDNPYCLHCGHYAYHFLSNLGLCFFKSQWRGLDF